MRIGILGGTFNPVHAAHVQMAVAARDALGLDLVLLMVAADPPHKRVAEAVDGARRLRMAELAAADLPRIEASDLELRRPGRSYTFDTLTELHARYPGASFHWIVGSDMLLDLPTWHRVEELFPLCEIVSFPRAGESGEDAAAAERLRRAYGARVRLLPSPVEAISSTQVRACVRDALPTEGAMPEAVAQYVYETGLYLPPDVEALRARLCGALSPRRYRHTMGVVRQAAWLCGRYDADGRTRLRARVAALLHDCAKQLPPARLAVLGGDDTPGAGDVLHAFAGAVLARMAYGVTDDAVLRAIRLHCTGDAGMTLLDMIVYLSDLTEPGRAFDGAQRYRDALAGGPEAAMRPAIAGVLDHLRAQGAPVHPATLRAARYFDQPNTVIQQKEEHR